MSNIALIGPGYLVGPLKAGGIEVFGADTVSAAEQAIEKVLDSEKYLVVFITEGLALACAQCVAKLKEKLNLVLLPDSRGSVGLFKEKLEKLIREATGA